MKLTHQLWKDLAGSLFDELVQSKESAFAHLFDADRNVRVAAINICEFVWHCSADTAFITACQRLAATDPDAYVRVHAIGSFGRALQCSRQFPESQFLADIVKDSRNPHKVRMAAYWALREIQLGLTAEDLAKSLVPVMKEALNRFPSGLTEEEVKQTLLFGGRDPETIWESAEQIDWSFVDQFASQTG